MENKTLEHGHSLSILDAVKYYKKFRAIDHVSLTVSKGEFLTILGPSGSGKTSLLKLIAGFENLNSGSILLNGIDITSKKAYEREIGMVFQNYALFPHYTVFENIAYPLRLRKYSKEEITRKVNEMLQLVQLEEYRNRLPKQLSGGQQQRVALARAIVFNPPILLLDEPLGALDKNLRQHMQLEIKHIQEKVGITTISVTHDQEEALTMSDRICVMNQGRIEQIDTPTNLYQNPKNRFVAEFIGEINLIKGEITDGGSDVTNVKIDDDHIIIVSQETINTNKEVLIALRPENIRLATVESEFHNTVRAKINEIIYVGDAIKFKAQMLNGANITVKVPSLLSDSIVNGKEILLGWNSKDATLLSMNSMDLAAV